MGQEGEWVVVEVADCGIGIPLEQLPLVFEPHFRGTNAPGERGGGLGLGLYISRGIAEAHGGEIQVESEEGKGSTFRLYLPAAGSTGTETVPLDTSSRRP